MNEVAYIDIQFKGKNLSPGILAGQIGLPIETLVSSGDIGKTGRYRGKPLPYGIGLLKINPTVETIHEYSDLLLKNKSKLQENNVDEIVFDVDATVGSLEKFSFSGDLLKKISALDARIQFHKHEDETGDISTLINKIISTLSTLSVDDKEKIKAVIRSKWSDSNPVLYNSDMIYEMMLSFVETGRESKALFWKNLEEVASELENI